MAYYIQKAFNLQLDEAQYTKKLLEPMANNSNKEALQTLLAYDVIPYATILNSEVTLSRKEFIERLVKTYALSTKVALNQTTYSIADLDGQDPVTPVIVYAYDQKRLDYILVQTKGQLFLYPNQAITLDEVYELVTAVTEKKFITGIIQFNQQITQGEIATVLMQAFNLRQKEILTQPTASNTTIVDRVVNLFARL